MLQLIWLFFYLKGLFLLRVCTKTSMCGYLIIENLIAIIAKGLAISANPVCYITNQ